MVFDKTKRPPFSNKARDEFNVVQHNEGIPHQHQSAHCYDLSSESETGDVTIKYLKISDLHRPTAEPTNTASQPTNWKA